MSPATSMEVRSFHAFGHAVAILSDSADAPWFGRLDALVPGEPAAPATRSSAVATISVRRLEEGTGWRIEQNGAGVTRDDEDALLRELEWRIFTAGVSHSPFPLIVHAGAVVRDGQALLLPAVSGSGKTTLALALAARGWLPLTDDLCPIVEREGQLLAAPCHRCGHVSDATLELLQSNGVALEGPIADLPGYYRPTAWGKSAPVGLIVMPRYAAESPLSCTPLTQAEVAAHLIASTFAQEERRGNSLWSAAIRLACQVRGFRLTYAALDEAFALMDTLTGPGS